VFRVEVWAGAANRERAKRIRVRMKEVHRPTDRSCVYACIAWQTEPIGELCHYAGNMRRRHWSSFGDRWRVSQSLVACRTGPLRFVCLEWLAYIRNSGPALGVG
jgi:hypothetical protein